MSGLSRNDWFSTFQRLAAVFPLNSPLPPEQSIEVYAEAMANYNRKQMHSAVAAWLRTGTRFPYPADLIGLIESGRPAAHRHNPQG